MGKIFVRDSNLLSRLLMSDSIIAPG
ncbi:MAG: hypothetical protein IKV67_08055 [Paludibacteraceae bacterium]|nr:hypothetical protein [Paludibacteraceae bacterium]